MGGGLGNSSVQQVIEQDETLFRHGAVNRGRSDGKGDQARQRMNSEKVSVGKLSRSWSRSRGRNALIKEGADDTKAVI